jgi:integrase
MPARSSGAHKVPRSERFSRLPTEMQESIHEFEIGLHSVSESTKDSYMSRVIWFGSWLIQRGIREFNSVSKKDLDTFLSEYTSANTKNHYIQVFRRLYNDTKPEVVSHLKILDVEVPMICPADILTPDEVVSLAIECGKRRDMMKALVLTLYDCGCRIGELLNCRLGDVKFSSVVDKEGKRVLISTLYFRRSKGGVDKEPVTCVSFAADLKKWVDNHPSKGKEEAWLFPSPKNPEEPVSQSTVADSLWYAGQRLGIKKRVNPHFLRHSSLSYLANSRGYSDVMLKIRAGWTTTAMAQRYIHTGAEIERRFYLEKMGLVEDEKEPEKQIVSKTCLHCQAINSALNDICDVCLFPLDPQAYKKEVERRRNVEQLNVNIEKLADRNLTPEQQSELKKRTDTCLALLELGRDDLAREYMQKLLEHWTKAFLLG